MIKKINLIIDLSNNRKIHQMRMYM